MNVSHDVTIHSTTKTLVISILTKMRLGVPSVIFNLNYHVSCLQNRVPKMFRNDWTMLYCRWRCENTKTPFAVDKSVCFTDRLISYNIDKSFTVFCTLKNHVGKLWTRLQIHLNNKKIRLKGLSNTEVAVERAVSDFKWNGLPPIKTTAIPDSLTKKHVTSASSLSTICTRFLATFVVRTLARKQLKVCLSVFY